MNTNLDSIIEHNLNYIPEHLSDIYLSIVKNTYNISNIHSPERFHKLYRMLEQETGVVGTDSNKIFFIEHGEGGLRELFLKLNSIEGRLDQDLPFLNITQILQFLALVTYSEQQFPEVARITEQLRELETIVILSDICISGTSLLGDLSALKKIVDLLSPHSEKKINVVALVLSATETAVSRLKDNFSFVAVQEIISDKYSLQHSDSIIATTADSKKQVLELSEWFVESVVQESDLLWRMSEALKDPQIMFWGFDKGGWLLTGDLNTPNNSFPLLWHKPLKHPYLPPFPRVSSRNYETDRWNLRDLYWKIIKTNMA